jgi:DNA-binding transcriptional MerR regulator
MSYRIQRVSQITGIAPATLRAWERRYRLVDPERTAKGYRLYTEDDVARLRRVKDLMDGGLKIGEAVELVRRTAPALLPPHADAEGPLEELRTGLRGALLAMDRAGALRVWERLAHVSPVRRVDEVLLPLMAQLGDLWAERHASVAQEHFASAFVRERLVLMREEMEEAGAAGPLAVCAGPPGDLHEFGLMATALHLLARGWRIVYLGLDVPLDDLRAVLQEQRPALLCVSVITPLAPDCFRELTRRLREAAPEATGIAVGGGGIPCEAWHEGVPGVRLHADHAGLFARAN